MMSANAATIFVAPEARGTGDGSTWENAAAPDWGNYTADDVIYLCAGKYVTPKIRLTDGVKIYGGYDEASTGTDISLYDTFANETILTPEGTNTEVFIDWGASGDRPTTPSELETVIAGVTITGVAGCQNGKSTGSVMMAKGVRLTMKDVIVTENETKYVGCIICAYSIFKSIDCVFSNNASTMELTKAPTVAPIVFSVTATGSTLFLERCAIYGNYYTKTDNMEQAGEGGIINVAKQNNVVLVNNFIDGCGLSVYRMGGFMRTNGGENAAHSGLVVLAYNTIFNFATHTPVNDKTGNTNHSTGQVMTLGAQTIPFIGGNIIVGVTPTNYYDYGETTDPNYNKDRWTECEDNLQESITNNAALGMGRNTGTANPWLDGGFNFLSGRTMVSSGHYWTKDDRKISTAWEKGSQWKLSSQDDVLDTYDSMQDLHNSYIQPLDGKNIDKTETAHVKAAWDYFCNYLAEDSKYAHLHSIIPDLKQMDLTVDGLGMKRGETTWSGSYDPNGVESGVSNIYADNEKTIEVRQIADGVFAVKGATATVEAYDMAGRKVATGNEIIDLSAAANGIYVVKAGAASAKIIR